MKIAALFPFAFEKAYQVTTPEKHYPVSITVSQPRESNGM
jgi:hypothetical protein